jgi:hypothetical protein
LIVALGGGGWLRDATAAKAPAALQPPQSALS